MIPDLILIDDDQIVCTAWQHVAQVKKIRFFTYCSIEDFLKNDHKNNSIVILDYNLNNKTTYKCNVEQIVQSGYHQLYISTGYPKSSIEKHPGICGIFGKDISNFSQIFKL